MKVVNKARLYRLDSNHRQRAVLLNSMQAEIDVLRTIGGKNSYIIDFIDVYEDKHFLYIVMQECRGGELLTRIQSKGSYSEIQASKILSMIFSGIHFMHDLHNIVHCDLKPDNILFLRKKEDSIIKIIDFGMAKVLPRMRLLSELVGTPYYTAPEILDGRYAHGADCWSIGVIMFVMLFGYPPFYVDPQKYYGKHETHAIYRKV